MVQAVSDVGSNAQENIAHAAEIIGKSEHRRLIFDAIYTGKRKMKDVMTLMTTTRLPRTRVLDAGKKLADNKIVTQTKIGKTTAYEKIGFFQAHKQKILSLAASPSKLKRYPTKRNAPVASPSVQVPIRPARARVKQISIDDIDSLKTAWSVEAPNMLENEMSEETFKTGLQKIIGESGTFKDWGGEVADLYTTRLKIGGVRKATAIALKGPAQKGKLTPGKMGKNGDQIQRLLEAPAEVFLIQYCRQIDHSVVAQMEKLAIVRSLFVGKPILFGIIDGQDSKRITMAYAGDFTRKARRRRGQ